MIRHLFRWLAVAWAVVAASALVLGREAWHVGVGGYTRGDSRNPRQVRRRIAALEHEVLPGKIRHDDDCPMCDPDARRRYRYSIKKPDIVAWTCATCHETGRGGGTMLWHWEETDHGDYDSYAVWEDAYRAAWIAKTGKDLSFRSGEPIVPALARATVPPMVAS